MMWQIKTGREVTKPKKRKSAQDKMSGYKQDKVMAHKTVGGKGLVARLIKKTKRF